MADLIDRQELLKHKGNCYDEEGHLLYAVGTGTILLMPTVDAEPVRHGRWDGDTCSVCGFSWCEVTYEAPQVEMSFCPNCGAKMDEVEDAD